MIRSTFAGFTTAQLGMAASQRALDVVGQNITNINTPGYTKQRLDIASLNTQKGDFYNSNSVIKVGFGVEMTGVSQLRDPFLDAQYRSQISKLGTTDAHAAGYEEISSVFDETTMDGVRAAFRSLSSSLSTLHAQAGNKENDTMVRSNAQILLNLFHENATRLKDVRENMETSFMKTDIGDLNKILENIAELNVTIKNSQVLGNPALELQDQRNSLLDELGSYLPIDVKYKDKALGEGQYVQVLNVDFVGSDGLKYSLINDGNYARLSAMNGEDKMTLFLSDAKGGTEDITDILSSGTMKGTLDLLNKSGDFDGTDFKGIGYYEKALDELVNEFALAFNKANLSIEKVDAKGDAYKQALDENGQPIQYTQEDGTKTDLYEHPLFVKSDPNDPTFTASNIRIAEDWSSGRYGITLTNKLVTNGTETGSTGNENVLNMMKLLDSEPTKFIVNGRTFFTGNFYDCFANIEATLGIDYKSAETTLENHITVLNQISNSRDGVSGVQLDEEGMDLLHYNQSYTAAARLMTTLDEALDVLINRTGVVGR